MSNPYLIPLRPQQQKTKPTAARVLSISNINNAASSSSNGGGGGGSSGADFFRASTSVNINTNSSSHFILRQRQQQQQQRQRHQEEQAAAAAAALEAAPVPVVVRYASELPAAPAASPSPHRVHLRNIENDHRNQNRRENEFFENSNNNNVSVNHNNNTELDVTVGEGEDEKTRYTADDDDAPIDVTPPAAENATRDLIRMMDEQRNALDQLRQERLDEIAEREKNLLQMMHNQNQRSGNNKNNNNARKQEVEDFSLPSNFVPVPPNRWRLPPSLPPRRRLVADGPRLDLLETLDQLHQQELEKNNNFQNNSNRSGGAGGGLSTAGSRMSSDLWVTVFEFLDPRELCRAAEVCRRWLCMARSEFLWLPILRDYFSHVIQVEEDEDDFNERMNELHFPPQQNQQDQNQSLLSAAPPRPLGGAADSVAGGGAVSGSTSASTRRQQPPPQNADSDPYSMCPSLARISEFVEGHRGRVRGELRAAENRVLAAEQRISQSQIALRAAAVSFANSAAQNNNNNSNQNRGVVDDITALERTVTNERNALMRELQSLEPKVQSLLDRLREAERSHSLHARELNEAIVSSRRSGMQLTEVNRHAAISEKRHREKVALEELERKICLVVLNPSPLLNNLEKNNINDNNNSAENNSSQHQHQNHLLPVSLRRSVRAFSQLELVMMSCASQPALSHYPKRWQRVKDTVLNVDAFESLRRQIDNNFDDPRGILEAKLATQLQQTKNNNQQQNGKNSSDNNGGGGASATTRFSDVLLNNKNRAPRVSYTRGGGGGGGGGSSATTTSTTTTTSSAGGGAAAASSSFSSSPSRNVSTTFSQDTDLTRQKIIAEMCNMKEDELESFIFGR